MFFQALDILHRGGLVHTGMTAETPVCFFLSRPDVEIGTVNVKLDNMFKVRGQNTHFVSIQLSNCGIVLSQNFKFAEGGHHVGTGFTRSPAAIFRLPQGAATDI